MKGSYLAHLHYFHNIMPGAQHMCSLAFLLSKYSFNDTLPYFLMAIFRSKNNECFQRINVSHETFSKISLQFKSRRCKKHVLFYLLYLLSSSGFIRPLEFCSSFRYERREISQPSKLLRNQE